MSRYNNCVMARGSLVATKISTNSVLVALLLSVASLESSAGAQLTSPAAQTSLSGTGQTSASSSSSPSTGNLAAPSVGAFNGSVQSGKVSAEAMELSLSDALDRGLKYNLGLILSEQSRRREKGARLKALSDLLPNVNARVAETVQQTNLAAFGFSFPGVPSIIGPFSVSDARASLSMPLIDIKTLQSVRAATEDEKAAGFSYKEARETVVLVVANLYLKTIADAAQVDAAQAQLKTAQAAFTQSADLKKSGVAAGIDVVRSQVELQVRRQRLLTLQNDYAKQKLALARAIGIPLGQQLNLTDTVPYVPPPEKTLDEILNRAYTERADYQRAQTSLRAAEFSRKSARAGAFPTLRFDGDYGVLGRRFNSSHGTFSATPSLRIPIFQGGRVAAEVIEADATLKQRQAELENVRGQIDNDVRTAFLDVQSADQQVDVAKSSVELATEELRQAQDRFASGVANSLEVVQAQEAVAGSQETYINTVYAFNIAKALLARSAGIAEQAVKAFLGGK